MIATKGLVGHLLITAFVLFSVSITSTHAQVTSTDSLLIASQQFKDHAFDARKVSFMKVGNNALTRYNPLSLTFSGLLFFYQKVVSAQIAASCPYEISCSNFSKQCIGKYGLLKGVALSADRLMRCNKIAAYDIHPLLITDDQRIHDPIEKYRLHK